MNEQDKYCISIKLQLKKQLLYNLLLQSSIYQGIKMKHQSIKQSRPSSSKSYTSRQSLVLKQSTNIISSTFRKQQNLIKQNSKQFCKDKKDQKKNKIQEDTTDYIRNLYKKYLGKENVTQKKRNQHQDVKDLKDMKRQLFTQIKSKNNNNTINKIPKTSYISQADRDDQQQANQMLISSSQRQQKNNTKYHETPKRKQSTQKYPSTSYQQSTQRVTNVKAKQLKKVPSRVQSTTSLQKHKLHTQISQIPTEPTVTLSRNLYCQFNTEQETKNIVKNGDVYVAVMNDYLAYNICTHNDTMISKGLQRIFKAKHKKNN